VTFTSSTTSERPTDPAPAQADRWAWLSGLALVTVDRSGHQPALRHTGDLATTPAALMPERSRIGLEGGRMTKIWGLSKPAADYGPAPKPEVRCDRCKFMFPPLALGGCRLVRGVISGSSSCKEFVPRHADRTEAEA